MDPFSSKERNENISKLAEVELFDSIDYCKLVHQTLFRMYSLWHCMWLMLQVRKQSNPIQYSNDMFWN